MENVFIETANTRKFFKLCDELTDKTSLIGPSLAMVTGPAGRGKSEAAKHFATQTDAVYIPPMNVRSPAMVLREIAFELAKIKPTRTDACLQTIGDEMSKMRRLVIIDEADLLPLQILEMLRNVNERYACPILLIGEDELRGKIASRRRLASRIRRKMDFLPVTQGDVSFFFEKALNIKLSADVAAVILNHAKGDWRPVLTTAIGIERSVRASAKGSNGDSVTGELVKEVIKSG